MSHAHAPAPLHVEPLAAHHREGFRALMQAQGLGCFCRYWHFSGNKNQWLERSVFRPEENEEEQFRDPQADDSLGLVALADGAVVGWLKLAPRAALPKLLAQPVYRPLDLGSPEGVYSVGCFLVDESWRGRGVARALLRAAPALVRARGGHCIEAYPRRASYRLHDAEAQMGPEALFLAEGFEVVHDEAPYPVLQRSLRAG